MKAVEGHVYRISVLQGALIDFPLNSEECMSNLEGKREPLS